MINDQNPLCTREISDDCHTVRATVDVAGDGLYGFLAMEPTDPTGRQMFKSMERRDWIALMDMAEQMVRAWDRYEDFQQAQSDLRKISRDRERMMHSIRRLGGDDRANSAAD